MYIFLLTQEPPEIVVRINELTFAENTEILRTKSITQKWNKIQDKCGSTTVEQ